MAAASQTLTLNKCQSGSDQQSTADLISILHKWGIHTLGQFAALDKEELRTRLGSEAVRLWERANGSATRLLKLVQPPETFDENFEFDYEIETAQPLFFILRRFLEQLTLRLNAIYLLLNELTLRITFANKQVHERIFKIPEPTNNIDLLFRVLQTHLENFKSEFPIVAVSLNAKPIRPASQQFGLFETALRNPQQLYQTLACLTALLGSDRVGTPVLEETHRPDAFRIEPFAWHLGGPDSEPPVRLGPSQHSSDTTRPVSPVLKPALRRFRPPKSASVFSSAHAHLQSEKVFGKIVAKCGPFLLSGNWWDEKSWAREEWDMQLENGELVRAHEIEGTWKVDGIYD